MLDPLYGLHASREARVVFTYLYRRGGSVRLDSLLRGSSLERRVIGEAIIELSERYWITLVWRKTLPGTPDDEPRPYTDIERLVSTRFGRRKYRAMWPSLD
jgi:hypothetical protein